MRMTTQRDTQRRGTTLLELLACMAVAGALLAITVPRYAAWRNVIAAREAASDLAGVLGSARETAVFRGGFIAVVLDTTRGAVDSRAAGRLLSHRDEHARYGVAVAANRDSVVYDPTGLGYGANSVTIVVSRGAAAETITVSRLGRVHW